MKNDCNHSGDFTAEQIIRCSACRYASEKVKWCGKYGIEILLPGEVGLPSMPRMAVNYAVDTAAHVANGCKKRSDSGIATIRATCKKCDNNIYHKDKIKCRLCGCPIDKKIERASSRCPIGRWVPEKELIS